jgi:hypothetical protein
VSAIPAFVSQSGKESVKQKVHDIMQRVSACACQQGYNLNCSLTTNTASW